VSFAPVLTWEQYQQLPPAQRRRPLTEAEYAQLTKQQRIAAGFEEDDQGAPADFSGRVFPNPTHIQPHADTDPAIDPTRLPEGVTFQRGNWSGSPQMDISNPAAADVLPAMGREIGTDFSNHPVSDPATVPIFDPQGNLRDVPYAQMKSAVNAGGKPAVRFKDPKGDVRFVPADRTADAVKSGGTLLPIEDQDIKHPGFWHTVAEDFVGAAHAIAPGPTALADAAIGGSFKDSAKNLLQTIAPGLRTGELAAQTPQQDAARKAAGYSLPYRAAAPIAQAAGANVPGMEQSAAAGDVGGVAGHVAAAEAPYVAGAVAPALAPFSERLSARLPESSRVAQTVGKTAADVASDVPIVRQLAKIKKNWEATAPAPAPPPAAAAAPLDATAENKPFAGEPPPKPAPVLDATGENKPFAGGMDEYVPPRPKAPRTIVTDPATGRPEFSDVVEAKQAAPPETKGEPAPVETKAVTTETPPIGEQPVAKGTPAETPGPAADDLLERLKGVADRIQQQETAAPGSADEDLVQQAQDSLDMVRARKAVGGPQPKTSAESLDEFNQRLSAIADRKAATAAGQAPGGASSGANSLQPSAGGAIPKYVYRVRDVGESGVPANGWANTSLEEAQSHLPGREDVQGKPQEIVRIDTSKLDPAHYTFTPGPGAHDWVKFKFAAPERAISPAGAGATKVQ